MNDLEFLQTLGRQIRELRNRLGWSQEQLAAACNLDRTYIGGIERGERNLTVLKIKLLAEALGVSPAELLPCLS